MSDVESDEVVETDEEYSPSDNDNDNNNYDFDDNALNLFNNVIDKYKKGDMLCYSSHILNNITFTTFSKWIEDRK